MGGYGIRTWSLISVASSWSCGRWWSEFVNDRNHSALRSEMADNWRFFTTRSDLTFLSSARISSVLLGDVFEVDNGGGVGNRFSLMGDLRRSLFVSRSRSKWIGEQYVFLGLLSSVSGFSVGIDVVWWGLTRWFSSNRCCSVTDTRCGGVLLVIVGTGRWLLTNPDIWRRCACCCWSTGGEKDVGSSSTKRTNRFSSFTSRFCWSHCQRGRSWGWGWRKLFFLFDFFWSLLVATGKKRVFLAELFSFRSLV